MMNYEEKWAYEQAKEMIKPGMFCIDIGANNGSSYTAMMLERTSPGGIVWSFEPSPTLFKVLSSLGNDGVEYTPFNVGLSDKEDVRNVYHYQYWSLFDIGSNPQKETYAKDTKREFFTCTFKTLDSIAKPRKIDFIKIDVDGHEGKILRGAKESIKSSKPSILIELGHFVAKYFGESIYDIAKFLIDLGYVGNFYDMHNVRDPSEIANRTPAESTIDFLFVQDTKVKNDKV